VVEQVQVVLAGLRFVFPGRTAELDSQLFGWSRQM
jgi:hypothetical protein